MHMGDSGLAVAAFEACKLVHEKQPFTTRSLAANFTAYGDPTRAQIAATGRALRGLQSRELVVGWEIPRAVIAREPLTWELIQTKLAAGRKTHAWALTPAGEAEAARLNVG